MVQPARITGIETGTGITWEEWLRALEPHKEADHTELARFALEYIEKHGESTSPEWWAQGVVVAYEQHIGRRAPGQATDGSFNVTVSKTVKGDMDEALTWWLERVKGVDHFDGVRRAENASTTHTEKWRYWRCILEDGSKISVNIQTKPGGDTSLLAVNHDRLPSADLVERKRVFWKKYLT